MVDATLDLQVMRKAADVSTKVRRAKLDALKKHLASGEAALVADAVDAFLHDNKFLIARSTPEWVTLARRFIRAEIEAMERTFERDDGEFFGTPRDSLVKLPAQPRKSSPQEAASGETIAQALAAFRRENPKNVSVSRMEESCRDIGIFIQTVGPSFNIAELGKKHVREWKTLLTQYPLRATEVVELRNLTISEAVAANEQLKRPVLSDRTVNRYLSSLSAFLSWAVDNGYMDKQPVLGKRCIDPLRLHPLQIFLPPLPWRAINFPAIRRIRAFLKC